MHFIPTERSKIVIRDLVKHVAIAIKNAVNICKYLFTFLPNNNVKLLKIFFSIYKQKKT